MQKQAKSRLSKNCCCTMAVLHHSAAAARSDTQKQPSTWQCLGRQQSKGQMSNKTGSPPLSYADIVIPGNGPGRGQVLADKKQKSKDMSQIAAVMTSTPYSVLAKARSS